MATDQDDEPLDSWEDIDENSTVLEGRLEKLALKNSQTESSMHPPVVTCEDSTRTPFTPQEPKIMILRRPQGKPDATANGMVSLKQKQPVKTLEQREADYAAARLRIMGSTSKSVEEPMLTGNPPGSHLMNMHREPQSNVGVVRTPKGPDGTAGFGRGTSLHR
ncbi:SUZ domain-containing protein 1-like isoform X2 [Penaeus japonicus]|uniref:SUZ domain-containing protein 1-like isoform X2 n=1 Tax=Penaeus japonicus TaxID=27405 RepID=UPI001C70F5DF|nr:SUZ domain-containing protein 1-like isoform X2 [Penaeus japonicus]